jgi:hypothetical protein
MPDSPVDEALRAGPRGKGDWPGFPEVYRKIAAGAEAMARKKYVYLSDDHVQTMADLGSGHEERMKSRLWWLREYGYLREVES